MKAKISRLRYYKNFACPPGGVPPRDFPCIGALLWENQMIMMMTSPASALLQLRRQYKFKNII